MKTISLYTGAGGLDIGLEAAGFTPVICIELDSDARETIEFNRPLWPLLGQGNIHAYKPEEILEQSRLRPREASLLCGGPPCQPFSKAAMWVNGKLPGLADYRANTLEAFINIAEVALPKVILLENVRAILKPGIYSPIKMLTSGLNMINNRHRTKYHWSIVHINAADFGVPQTRERVYLFANREGLNFQAPRKTHSSVVKDRSFEPYFTAWDAIGGLDTKKWDEELTPKGKWAGLLPSIPEGWNYLWHTDKGRGNPIFGWRTRFWSFLLKLAKDRPSWTLPANPGPATGPFHWRNRLLSQKELCRIQTFPDDYIVKGKYASVRRQVGNAVPPLIGEIIGREICKQWLGQVHKNDLHFLPSRNNDPPVRSRIKQVPKQYLHLVGNHEPHPGVGKGPRAISQFYRATSDYKDLGG